MERRKRTLIALAFRRPWAAPPFRLNGIEKGNRVGAALDIEVCRNLAEELEEPESMRAFDTAKSPAQETRAIGGPAPRRLISHGSHKDRCQQHQCQSKGAEY